MISYVLVILASFCNALMDTLAHHHSTSIFKNYKTGFWSDAMAVSWKNKYIDGDPTKGRKKNWVFNVPVQFTDAWHFFKSLMIIFLIAAMPLYTTVFGLLIDFCVLGLAWNFSFTFFYNVIFRK